MAGAVAAPAPVAAANNGNAAAQDRPSIFMTVMRMVMFYYFINNFFGKKAPPKDPALLMTNLFQRGEELDMWVYINEAPGFHDFRDEQALVWKEEGIKYAVYNSSGERSRTILYRPSLAAQNNGSVWAHVFFARSGYSPDPKSPDFERRSTFGLSHSLVDYKPRPKIDRRKNLLGGSITKEGAEAEAAEAAAEADAKKIEQKVIKKVNKEDEDEWDGEEPEFDNDKETEAPREIISFWKPNMTLSFVDDFTAYVRGQVPDPIRENMNVDLESGNYFPTTVVNDFWLLQDKLIQVNETVEELPLTITVGTLQMWKWTIYFSMDKSFKMQQQSLGAMESESDAIKRVFLEGNPVLLGITLVVSLFHTLFDFLSFKNDIQFWNQNKSMEGLSARSIVLNFFCQLVIFLYLLDNETSWMILLSSGVSVCIEFWKIGKAMHISIDRSGRIPMLRFSDRESYTSNKTKEYDALASKYLSYALYPLIACYAVYSLVYETHKSWYSWVLGTLTGCVYTFGFIMMCPQLFINYKLKSVAHLPWRQMTYKFLNTIIDDLFAFVIKMPLLHRLSVFRDDIIFLIYLYQRWIYPVDKKRVNEFGYGGPEASAQEGEAATPAIEEKKDDEPNEELVSKAGTDEVPAKSKVGISEEGLTKRKGK